MNFIRVNMKSKKVKTEAAPEKYMVLGGRGLTSILINSEVPPKCNPIGPENKLVFATGILGGTSLINTSRTSIGAKSPLTGGIKESNVGGTAGAALGRLGIGAVIIEDKAPKNDLSILKIDVEGKASLVSADEYKGMGTYELVEKLLKSYGKKNSVLCIGPAGENQMKIASIQGSDVDSRPCRSAGRGGLGALMGAKGLKAVVVAQGGKNASPIADPDAFNKSAKVMAKLVKADQFLGQVLPALGTSALVGIVNSMGALPSYNAIKGEFEGWQKISGEAMAELIKKREGKTTHVGCSQCIIQCSNIFLNKQGKYVTSSLEYETIWSMGSMTGIDDIDTIARLDYLCDDIGLDTMSTGVAIAVGMDGGYKKFGDSKGAIEILEEIGKDSEIGRIFGNGPDSTGKHFKNKRVPTVKGQSIAGYDPRAMLGIGITYATCPMGADHTAGNVLGAYLTQQLNPLEKQGQVEVSREIQIMVTSIDNAGLCLFLIFILAAPEGQEAFLNAINAKLGTKMSADEFRDISIRILKAEREFNKKAGLTKKDDRLPGFFYKEALPPHNAVFNFTDKEIDSTFSF